MTYPIFAIRDCVLDAFEPPFLALHDAAASRTFRNLLDDSDSPYSKNISDYSLWRVGTFDTVEGVVDCTAPVRIMSGFGGETDGKEV